MLAADVPACHARTVRELVQKECDADSRGHDTLVSRGNAMLGAAGVGLALLVGFSKEASVDTTAEKSLLVTSLFLAILTVAFVLLSVKLRLSHTVMRNTTLFGGNVPLNIESEPEFKRQHELQVALAYADARIEYEKTYFWRAKWLRNAQFAYLAFLFSAGCFAVSLPM
jgi:hypothetical protein